jgi:serine/threonine-protein kinase RsbW
MLKLTSDPRNIGKIESLVKKLANKYRISSDLYPNILISLTEAVNNAIVHGNNQDQNKYVNINIEEEQNVLSFRISDEGAGFNHSKLPDPTAPENIECLGGRGVFLIKQLSDRVNYYNNGSTVEIQFNL